MKAYCEICDIESDEVTKFKSGTHSVYLCKECAEREGYRFEGNSEQTETGEEL